MKCMNCGAEFDAKFKFCPECGTSVSSVSGMSGDSAMERELNEGATMSGPAVAEGEMAGEELSMGYGKTVVQGAGERVQGSGFKVEGSELRTRYEILEEIGRGGFARVWKARDLKLDRFVAVKRLIEPAVKDANWKMTVERFQREARAIAGLNHRNIVGVYDVGADAEGDYIVMELVEGGTLRDLLKERGKLEPVDAVAMARGIAQGLGHAHKKNLVHRDIKPANVLLLNEGGELTPKIVDFGLARVGTDSELSMSGYGMGTPWYMPPEQRRNAKGVNHTADIYALGKTLYELLTGEIPDQVDPDKVPPGLAKVILKCVKGSPEERYFSTDELVADLQDGLTDKSRKLSSLEPEKQNPCPECGGENALDAKFCEECGAGMTRGCPECGLENSVNKPFCKGCGTDIQGFLDLTDIVSRMEKYSEEKKWSRVFKEFGQMPKAERLKGEKGSVLRQEAGQLAKKAAGNSNELRKLEGDLVEQMGARKWSEAGRTVRRLLELAPEVEKLNEQLDTINHEWEKEEWNRALKKAKTSEEEGYLLESFEALESFKRIFPKGQLAAEADRKIAEMRAKGVAAIEQELEALELNKKPLEMQEFLEAGKKLSPKDERWLRWEDVLETWRKNLNMQVVYARSGKELDDVNRIWPGYPGVEDRRLELLAEEKDKRAAKEAQAMMLRKVKFALAGIGLLLLVVVGISWSARAQRNRQVRVALGEARTAQNQEDWPRMRAAADRALAVDERNQDARDLKRTAEDNLVTRVEIRAILFDKPVGATLEMAGRTHTLPTRIILNENQTYEGVITYELGGRRYAADPFSFRADWKGLRTRDVVLRELRGPVEGELWRLEALGLEMVWIPAGHFMMGSTAAERAWASGREGQGEASWYETERNPERVRIAKGFWMGRTTVTVAMFRRFVEATRHRTDAERVGKARTWRADWSWGEMAGKSWRDPGIPGYRIADNHPVVCVSWNDAMAFCRWLTETERAAGRLPEGYEYRLPGEAEWEYASRGGRQGTRFWWGDSVADGRGRANVAGTDVFPGTTSDRWTHNWGFEDGFAFLSPVDHYGERGRNGFGLADMLGNVWEWCYDAETGRAQSTIAKGDAGSRRVLRGGSFHNPPGLLRCAFRDWRTPTTAYALNGFRVVLGEIVR
jgi:sulfatase modifying factor 1